ncbi:hypothetical protein B0J13DRAFT_661267 [Dactylonectria estremocensis]|uniref:Uncharacterized protein n=1 Tax=Dactylonectria estremocensis TaxID=1079267 RepID=A0A9P9JBT8_9HYPO|nr:hypothetical protein B0J13DRAFT_661267 [Dactylonectria estremocensis]
MAANEDVQKDVEQSFADYLRDWSFYNFDPTVSDSPAFLPVGGDNPQPVGAPASMANQPVIEQPSVQRSLPGMPSSEQPLLEQQPMELPKVERLPSERQLIEQPLFEQPSVGVPRPEQPAAQQELAEMPWPEHPLLDLPMFDLDDNAWLEELDRYLGNPAEAPVYVGLTPPPDSDPQSNPAPDASAYTETEKVHDATLPRRNSLAMQTQPTAAQPQAAPRPLPQRTLQPPTFRYQGHIASHGEAASLRSTYNPFPDPSGSLPLSPAVDATMPQTDSEYRRRVEEIFTAVCDWSDLAEWRTRMGRENVKAWLAEVAASHEAEGSGVDVLELKDDQIRPPADRMPSLDEQWKNVTHREMDNLTIELLCTQILDEAVLAQKGLNHVPL